MQMDKSKWQRSEYFESRYQPPLDLNDINNEEWRTYDETACRDEIQFMRLNCLGDYWPKHPLQRRLGRHRRTSQDH